MRLDSYIAQDPMIIESINDRGIFKAVFMAGGAGSGKSYVLSKVKSGSIEPRVVNVDKFIEFYNTSYAEFYDKSKQLTKSQLLNYINSVLPLAIDMTAAHVDSAIQKQKILELLGYDTAMIFVTTSLETSLNRARSRTRKVPDEEVIKYHDLLLKAKDILRSQFPLFIEVKNDSGELTNDIVLKIFKRMSFFYEAPLKNQIGIETIRTMKENNYKYLIPNIYEEAELKTIVDKWYR